MAMEFEMHLRTLIRFDVLVNGGGAVTLQFQRSPFKPLTRTVFVPWNQIVVLPSVVMTLSKEGESYKSNQPPSPAVGKHRLSNICRLRFFLSMKSGTQNIRRVIYGISFIHLYQKRSDKCSYVLDYPQPFCISAK